MAVIGAKKGTQGVAGTVGEVVESGASGATSDASCPVGDVLTGGGYDGNGAQASFPTGGSPSTPPTGWQAQILTGTLGGVVAYAICAP